MHQNCTGGIPSFLLEVGWALSLSKGLASVLPSWKATDREIFRCAAWMGQTKGNSTDKKNCHQEVLPYLPQRQSSSWLPPSALPSIQGSSLPFCAVSDVTWKNSSYLLSKKIMAILCSLVGKVSEEWRNINIGWAPETKLEKWQDGTDRTWEEKAGGKWPVSKMFCFKT